MAMKRVKIAAWQMASCPNDAKGRRYWEEVVTWRCDELWKEAFANLAKEDYSNTTPWRRPHTGRCTYWEMPFTRFFGDAWIPKLERCKTWTEWLFLTKDFEYAWHSMLNLKYRPDSARGEPIPLRTMRKDSAMTVILGMSHGHQTVIVVLRFWETAR